MLSLQQAVYSCCLLDLLWRVVGSGKWCFDIKHLHAADSRDQAGTPLK